MSEKKKVLLIGDSIRIGYCETVKDQLKEIADVYYPDDNCRCTQYIIIGLGEWRNLCLAKEVEYIYFNAGHWDIAHWASDEKSLTSIGEYADNLKKIIRLMRNYFPNAKICYTTTTPMNPVHPFTSNPRSNEEIRTYNEVGLRVAEEAGIQTDDLYSFTENWDESCFEDYCHFTPTGFERLGRRVADRIKKEIE